ncbi:cupredoxin domain-containing protein, partial [Methanomethylovorans sp.]|uniref:cupredoxin domain-containing protein n=1 Tax=Methanomethylovorans sp. TaxID=2758717 RepID=UPI00351BFD12
DEATDQPIEDEPVDEEQQSEDDVVETTEITANEDGFDPETIRVMLGDTVTWTNTGQENVTITSDDDLFNSGLIGPGETYSYTFDVAGTFDYSSEEDFMTSGTVIVEPGEEGQEQMDDNESLTITNTSTEDTSEQGGNITIESDQPSVGTPIQPNDEEEDNDTL